MKLHNNHVVVDLSKVQFAKFGYMNQHGDFRRLKPKFSVFNMVHVPTAKAFGVDKTVKQHAKDLEIEDVWTPRLYLQLSANHSLIYTGKKAASLWREWNKRIFKQ
jgi:hypothetical protein